MWSHHSDNIERTWKTVWQSSTLLWSNSLIFKKKTIGIPFRFGVRCLLLRGKCSRAWKCWWRRLLRESPLFTLLKRRDTRQMPGHLGIQPSPPCIILNNSSVWSRSFLESRFKHPGLSTWLCHEFCFRPYVTHMECHFVCNSYDRQNYRCSV